MLRPYKFIELASSLSPELYLLGEYNGQIFPITFKKFRNINSIKTKALVNHTDYIGGEPLDIDFTENDYFLGHNIRSRYVNPVEIIVDDNRYPGNFTNELFTRMTRCLLPKKLKTLQRILNLTKLQFKIIIFSPKEIDGHRRETCDYSTYIRSIGLNKAGIKIGPFKYIERKKAIVINFGSNENSICDNSLYYGNGIKKPKKYNTLTYKMNYDS